MGKTRITCYLSEDSFKKAAEEVRKYAEELQEKCNAFGHEMLMHGYMVTKMTVDSISPFYKGNDLNVEIEETTIGGVYSGRIIMSGEQVAFIEFGSGTMFNGPSGSSKHPMGEELGLTIDSYNPSSGNATSPYGWWYTDKYGGKRHTYGTPTFMPLEKGIESIISDVTSIARGVFNG